ncbi:MAG: hypothetical protein AVDCRST_MAG86-990 [uncultured Truepera sp.]|uniref:Uncharacterized protein n=1 Tax=uncultured Truepera sp. TaxID=543023 RepID=A0A6J4V0Q7_9DEIN|nr:MAG: hypothetical protein AVDCRST_MAG86-990 [uncultured Truepera sp.]
MNSSELTWRAGVAYFRSGSRLQKTLFVSGTVLFLSMIFHLVVLAASGGPLSGPVSFRKPATFSETGWLLCWSVGWLLPLLNFRAWERVVVATGALVFGLGESIVAVIQAWRGVPFHYNTTSAFNTGTFALSGLEALVFFVSLVVLLFASLRPQRLAPSLLLSIRTGAVIVIFGTLAGWLMIFNWSGVWQGSLGMLEPGFDTDAANYSVGVTGGNLVVLHALGVHGLSLVPLAAWLLTFSALSERARTRLTAGVAESLFALLFLLAVQALRARPLFALDVPTAVLLGASALALVVFYSRVGRAALRGPSPNAAPYTR